MLVRTLVWCIASAAHEGAIAAPAQQAAALEAANMVGVLQYCTSHQHASADSVAHARSVLARQAAPSRHELDQAEALGRNGILLAAGQQHSLAELGRRSRQSVAAICEGLAMNADILASMLDSPGH